MHSNINDEFNKSLLSIRHLSVEARLTTEERRNLLKHIITLCGNMKIEVEKMV